MENQAIEQTQLREIKEQVSQFATSKTVRERIIDFQPSKNLEEVRRFQKETGEGIRLLENKQSVPFMASEAIDRLFDTIEDGYVLEPKELLEMSEFLRTIRKLREFFDRNQQLVPTLAGYASNLQSFRSIEETINTSIKQNQVKSEASRELKKARQNITRYDADIRERLNKFITHPSNQSKIQEFMIVERENSLTVPVKSAFKNSIKGRVVSESGKGATAYVQIEATRELSQKLQMAQAEESAIVFEILANLTEKIATELDALKETIQIVFTLEMILAKAKYSYEIQGKKVSINKQGIVHLIEAKHPLLGEAAVPLTIQLGKSERGLVITGSNSGGKTVVLKTVGLLTLMTMMGLFIPADKESQISLFDHILVDIGDYQDFDNALSTFSGHMKNMRAILETANEQTLVLVDEIGSGTEPSEGAALAIAMLENLVERGALVFASTHYGEIKEFAVKEPKFLTAAMSFDRETLQPRYQLLMNEVGASNGFWIARKMNIDEELLTRATMYMKNFSTVSVGVENE
ncbi:DNA mismatch repair protein MutS2 [Enterococcus sp. AZ194]|uniref:endonuclease MutS2 n=1 Tax=Enterococcus sp. AZ194 TaxID=2774629 RepID=UPI003F258592